MQFDSSSTPKLWFKRIVLFKALNPIEIIREIVLHRGLNIIVGKSSRNPALANNPMAMSGHSVGKTTCCRLLRYCLGEQHFSTESGEQRLRASLPYSWVGAELEIEGTPWAVLRPLGAQKAPSAAEQDTSIEELAAAPQKGAGYFEFRQELNKLLPPGVHHPELTYKWEHLLSWMTRDQECRLRKFEVWRDTESGSDVPGFRKPKEYPIHLVRGVLDLADSARIRMEPYLVGAYKTAIKLEGRTAQRVAGCRLFLSRCKQTACRVRWRVSGHQSRFRATTGWPGHASRNS